MQDKNSIKETVKQEPIALSDKNNKGKEMPWKEKKKQSLKLAACYERLGYKSKFSRVKDCGTLLSFKVYKETGIKKLHSIQTCQVRLCSMCNWRRSLKIYGQLSQIMDKALEKNEYRFLFLTLTCRNLEGEELSPSVDELFYGFNKLTKRNAFKAVSKGWFRALEITHDTDEFITEDMYHGNKKRHMKPRKKYYDNRGLGIGDENPSFDTYHPHFHVVLMVNKSYFKKPDLYITQDDWTQMWKESLNVDYTPIVDVRAFKTSSKAYVSKSVAEAGKYTVKDNDYLVPGNEKLTDRTVQILDNALSGRRLIAFGGELRKIHKELNLDDPVDGDLKNTDNEDENLREDLNYMIEKYMWNVGLSNYIRVEEK